MSTESCPQPDYNALIDDCQFDHILSQLEQYLPLRNQVANALRHANAAFATQYTNPDGYTFVATCNDLIKFFDLKVALEYSEQELVVQVLQVACAMHENAINNSRLTPAQRSSHYLATTSLLLLCRTALATSITYPDLWDKVVHLAERAEQAHARATDTLDLSKYLDFDNSKGDRSSESGNDTTGQTSATTNTTPPPVPKISKPVKSRGSVRDTTADARLTPRSAKLKEKALTMLNDKPYKAEPLGRRHTTPNLSRTAYDSRSFGTSAGRTSSKAQSRGHALHALREADE